MCFTELRQVLYSRDPACAPVNSLRPTNLTTDIFSLQLNNIIGRGGSHDFSSAIKHHYPTVT